MSKFSNSRYALVTGGAGGIGLELCRLMAEDGYNLLIVDQNEVGMTRASDDIQKEFGVVVKTLCKDLSNPDAPGQILEYVEKNGILVNILVNNAGYGISGKFIELDLNEQLKMMQVNISAVVSLTGLFLPVLLQQEDAAILNLASMAAFQAGPYMACYFASKAFVLSFSEALAMELEGTSISVTTLCPGPTDTGFAGRAGAEDSVAFQQTSMMKATEVAREAYNGLNARKTIVLPGVTNKLAILASRFVPRNAVISFAAKMNQQNIRAPQIPNAAV